jgi:hypothetical protein
MVVMRNSRRTTMAILAVVVILVPLLFWNDGHIPGFRWTPVPWEWRSVVIARFPNDDTLEIIKSELAANDVNCTSAEEPTKANHIKVDRKMARKARAIIEASPACQRKFIWLYDEEGKRQPIGAAKLLDTAPSEPKGSR